MNRPWRLSRTAVHRLAADGYDLAADGYDLAAGGYDWQRMATISPGVATCRQTVEALLAPPSTAWQRMATTGSGWLRFGLFRPRVELPCPVAIGAVFMIIRYQFRYAFSEPPLQFGADFSFLLR